MSRLFFIPQAVRINSTGTPFASAEANFHLTGTTTDTDTFTNNARTVAHANPVIADSAGQFPAIYLDPAITYRCIITQSSGGAQIDDIDPVHAPFTASEIAVVDAAANFAGTEIETVLTDIGDNYFKLSSTETVTANTTWSANILMADNEIQRPLLKDIAIKHNVVSSSSNVTTVDLSTGNSFITTLTENTTLAITNPPATGNEGFFKLRVIQDGSGGAFTLTQPGSVIVAAGGTWTITTSNDARDKGSYSTVDGGTIWELEFLQAYA